MRLAVIDLGTNSVRFDIVELGSNEIVKRLYREKLMIRLGEGVFLKKRLDPRSIKTCVSAFESFREILNEFRVRRVIAFGTSALREAKDSAKLIRLIERKAEIHLKIISGDDEARLIAQGILENELELRGKCALVDIGGGSTEVSVCRGRKILRSASFPLGTARLQQVFLKSIPPKPAENEIENLRRHIRGILLYRTVSEGWPKVSKILGSSGTVRAISRISRRLYGSSKIDRKHLSALIKEMSLMGRSELLRIPGMESRRVDMILAGAILLEECMLALHATTAETTEFSLRDGILDEEIKKMRIERRSILYDPIEEIQKAVVSLGVSAADVRQTIRISSDLFSELKRVHRLNERWKKYLVAASILQGIGRVISPIRSEGHSAYFARHVDVSGLETWESRLIAELCLYQKENRILKQEMPFKKDKALQKNFLKLLSLLRIAVAMSFQRTKPILIERIKVEPKTINVFVSKRYSPELALMRSDQRKAMFEEVFKKAILFELS